MTEYGQQSQFRDTAGLDAVKARELAGRLELRAKSPAEVEARQAYLDLLGVEAGECVLDVACGSGAVTRDIARGVVDIKPLLGRVPWGLADNARPA